MGYSYYRIADTSVNEGSGYANFTISRSGDTAYSERVLAYTGNGSATNNSDYSYKRDYVYFNPYETSKTFSVPITNDTYPESTEYFRVYLSSSGRRNNYSSYYSSSYTRISDSNGQGTIIDDDSYSPSYFSVSDAEVTEGGSLQFTLTRTGNTTHSGSVRYYTSSDTASDTADIIDVNSSVYFSSGETSKIISVSTRDDSLIEGKERIRLNLSGTSNSQSLRISDSLGYGTINDNDQYGSTSFSVADTSVIEGNSGQFIVSRSGDLREAGSVNYQLTYQNGRVTTGRLYFSSGASSRSISFRSQENYAHGDNKDISVRLTGYSLTNTSASFSDATAKATVTDDDPKPLTTSYFSVEADPVKEGLTGEFTVRRIGELSTAGQVIYRLTAPDGTTNSRNASFEENQETITISVPTQDNSTYGPNGSYKIQLIRAVLFKNRADIANANAVMKVLDDDQIPNRGAARFTIAGGSGVGSTKTIRLAAADPNGNGAFTHTWQQNNAGQWTDIGKGSSFKLRDAQEGKALRAISTYTDANGFTESVTTSAGEVDSRPLVMAREGLFDGNTVTLEFNRQLDETSVGNSRFQIKAGRRKMRVRDVEVNGLEGTVDIKLNRDVTYYDDLLITYKDLLGDQTNGVVQDVNGNDLKSLNSFKVQNSYSGPAGGKGDPLEVISAEYADGQVELEFNDEITNHKLNKRRFKVWAGKHRMRVTNAQVDDDAFVTLSVSARNGRVITEDTEMTLSYSDMRGDQTKGVIEDLAGYDLDSFKKMEVDVLI